MKFIYILLIIIALYLCYMIYNDYFNFCSYEYYSSVLELINNLKSEEEKKLQEQRDVKISEYVSTNESLKQTFENTKTYFLKVNGLLTPDLDTTKGFIIGNKSINSYLTVVNSGGINYVMFAYNKETALTKPECIFELEKTVVTEVESKALTAPINAYKIKHKQTGEYLSIPKFGYLPTIFPSFTFQNNNETVTKTISSYWGFSRTLPLSKYDPVKFTTIVGSSEYLVDFVFKDIESVNGYIMLRLDWAVNGPCGNNLSIRSGVNALTPSRTACDIITVVANPLNFFDVFQIN